MKVTVTIALVNIKITERRQKITLCSITNTTETITFTITLTVITIRLLSQYEWDYNYMTRTVVDHSGLDWDPAAWLVSSRASNSSEQARSSRSVEPYQSVFCRTLLSDRVPGEWFLHHLLMDLILPTVPRGRSCLLHIISFVIRRCGLHVDITSERPCDRRYAIQTRSEVIGKMADE